MNRRHQWVVKRGGEGRCCVGLCKGLDKLAKGFKVSLERPFKIPSPEWRWKCPPYGIPSAYSNPLVRHPHQHHRPSESSLIPVWLKNSSRLAVSKKCKFFNAYELIEGTGRTRARISRTGYDQGAARSWWASSPLHQTSGMTHYDINLNPNGLFKS